MGETVNDSAGDDTYTFKNTQGYTLHCKQWKPTLTSAKPKALVFINHGFAEHYGWYEEFAENLTKNNFLVFSHDHVGHGRSEGPRANISDFRTYVHDLFIHCDKLKEEYPDVPMFMLGHSMGGGVSLLAGLERPDYFSGIILEAPAVVPHPDSAQTWKVYAAYAFGRLTPWLPFPIYLDVNYCTRNKEVVEKIRTDPLNYQGGLKAGWGLALLTALDEIQRRLDEITCPLLTVHGDDDKLCDIRGARLVQEKASSQDKTLTIYPGGYHQLRAEPDGIAEKVTEEIITWIQKRI